MVNDTGVRFLTVLGFRATDSRHKKKFAFCTEFDEFKTDTFYDETREVIWKKYFYDRLECWLFQIFTVGNIEQLKTKKFGLKTIWFHRSSVFSLYFYSRGIFSSSQFQRHPSNGFSQSKPTIDRLKHLKEDDSRACISRMLTCLKDLDSPK